MLQIYSIVHNYTLKKINSQAYISKGKPLPLGTFVLKRNFTPVHFSDKLKPLRIGPYKLLDRLSDVTYELLLQNGSTFHIRRNHLIPYYSKSPLLYPDLRNSMQFSDSINTEIPKPNITQTVIRLQFFLTLHHPMMNPVKPLIHIFLILLQMILHPLKQLKKLMTLIHLILVFDILLTALLFRHPMIHLKIELLNLIINYDNNHERIIDFSFHPPKI